MLRTRHGWLVVVLAVTVGAVVCPACKNEQSSTPSGGDKSSSSYKGDDLSLLPADAEVVMSIDAGQILQSGVWKQFGERAFQNGRLGRKLTEIKDKCDLDPLATIKTIALGMKAFGNQADGVIVVHGIDKAKGLACIDKVKEPSFEVTRDGDVVLVKTRNGTVAVTFVNDTTAVMVLGAKATAAGVKSVIAGGPGPKAQPSFADMHSKVNTTDSLWFVVTGKALDTLAAIGARPKAAAGSVGVTDGIASETKLVLESAPVAAQLAEGLQQKAQLVSSMVDKIDITSEADQVKAVLVISNQKLQPLFLQLGSLLGGLLGT
jgi:hypothetical protein